MRISLAATSLNLLRRLLAPTSLVVLLAANGCSDAAAPDPIRAAPGAPPVMSAAPATSAAAAPTGTQAAEGIASAAAAPEGAAGLGKFSELVATLSEPSGEFFSDNLISNETSYLQVAGELAARPAGGVYLGVGPEQNFTYIALARPSAAFILDIRRDNLIQQLHYKALFVEARSRSHFLALLLGRPWDAEGDPGPGADIEAVIAHAEKNPADEATLAATLTRVRRRIEEEWGVALNANDRKSLDLVAKRFHERQLDIRFELHEKSGRRYPKLRELFTQGDPKGAQRGFLASEEGFRFVQRMQKEHRVIPLVGDFGGDRAMPSLAALLREKGLAVSAFYVSNVEQYLLEPKVWEKWRRNVAALPAREDALFIRAYLDQGRRHPKQMEGHRTATVLSRFADFTARQEKKPYRSFWDVSTDATL